MMTPEQIQTLIDFMGQTPDPHPHHKAAWWIGDMPAYPELYTDEDWEASNLPIVDIFKDYISDLAREQSETEDPDQLAYLAQARAILETIVD